MKRVGVPMSFETIKFNEVNQYIGRNNVLLVDVREQGEYNRGHLENAVNIPYEYLESYLYRFSPQDIIVLYCDRGNISLRAARDLYNLGYSVVNLAGGLRAYRGKLVK